MSDTSNLSSHFYLTLGGKQAPEPLMRDLQAVTVENSLHLPDVATLVLLDPRLHWIDDASLEPGTTLVIATRVGRNEQSVFDGEIVEIEPDFEPGVQRLVVRAFDRLHRLARGRHVRSFQNVTDGDLVNRIAQEVGLSAEVGPNRQVHPYILQHNESNLAFLQRRAAALGFLLFAEGTRLCCVPPRTDETPLELAWGRTMSEFKPRLTTIGQVGGVAVRGWNPQTKQAVVGQAARGRASPIVGMRQTGGELAEQAFQIEARHLVASSTIRSQAVAQVLAQAAADRLGGRFIEAEGAGNGNPGLVAGKAVRVSNVGDRFSGTYFITSSAHTYTHEDGYRTSFTISGLHPSTLLSLLAEAPEPGPGDGLVIGIVTDNQDPDNSGRVKVKYPWLSDEHASDWARVLSVGGGRQRGVQFLPEVNDEVLIGFEQGDINHPYILGGLWNGQDAPPRKSAQLVKSGAVQQRLILSRTGHLIMLDDTEGGGGITIADRQGNQIVLETGQNALTISAKGAITLSSQADLTIEAAGKLTIKGMGVEVDGQAATVDVKGSLIKLN